MSNKEESLKERERVFKENNVSLHSKDPLPNSIVAYAVASILLDCYRNREIERLQYKQDNFECLDSKKDILDRMEEDSYQILFRAYYILNEKLPKRIK